MYTEPNHCKDCQKKQHSNDRGHYCEHYSIIKTLEKTCCMFFVATKEFYDAQKEMRTRWRR